MCLAVGRRAEVEHVFSTPLLELVFHAASVHRMYNDPQMVRPPPLPPHRPVPCVQRLPCRCTASVHFTLKRSTLSAHHLSLPLCDAPVCNVRALGTAIMKGETRPCERHGLQVSDSLW